MPRFPFLSGSTVEVRQHTVQCLAHLLTLLTGFTGGGTSDPRYDLTNLVSASAAIGKPIIAASMNYRLGSWGFLAAKELSEFNFGLYDQRLALHWIQDNIAAFGGDKSKVRYPYC